MVVTSQPTLDHSLSPSDLEPVLAPDPSRRQVLTMAPATLAAAAAPALAVVGGDAAVLNNGMKFPKAKPLRLVLMVDAGSGAMAWALRLGTRVLRIYNDETAQQLTELAISLGYRNFFSSVLAT
eukprot:Skav230449  [mRNA]  locus=scaffold3496:200182:202238:- [translate_table: standard]